MQRPGETVLPDNPPFDASHDFRSHRQCCTRLFLVLLRATLGLGRAPELLHPVLALLACFPKSVHVLHNYPYPLPYP